MSETTTYKCDNCGAFVEWNGKTEKFYDNTILRLECPICEKIFIIDTDIDSGKSWEGRFENDFD